MDVDAGFSSSEPRVIFDEHYGPLLDHDGQRVPDNGCAGGAGMVGVEVLQPTALHMHGWYCSLPNGKQEARRSLSEQARWRDSSTIVVTFNDFDCSATFLGSEADFLQKKN